MSRPLLALSLCIAGIFPLPDMARARMVSEIAQDIETDARIDEYWRQSRAGDAQAQRILAILLSYDYALDGEIDADESRTIIRLLECAALQGDEPAIEQLQNIDANFDISETGTCFYTGAGYSADQNTGDPAPVADHGPSDDETDIDALRASAMDGDPASQFALAQYLDKQSLFFDDLAEVEGWYNCAARQGYAPAIAVLAEDEMLLRFEASEPCPYTDKTMASRTTAPETLSSASTTITYSTAPAPAPASSGSAPSEPARQQATAKEASRDALFADALAAYHGDGIAQDYDRALQLAGKAADLGHAGAINLLGVMYRTGTGLAQNDAEALRHFRHAAELGDGAAMANLADCYLQGAGVPANVALAVHWFKEASGRGNALAQYNLSSIYQSGADGIDADPVLARHWMKLAAQNGDPDAPYYYGYFLEYGIGGPEEPAQAIEWYQTALNLDDPNGYAAMGRMHYYGEHTTEDLELAWYYFSVAAARGHEDAKTWMDAAAPHVSYEQRARASAQLARYLAQKGTR